MDINIDYAQLKKLGDEYNNQKYNKKTKNLNNTLSTTVKDCPSENTHMDVLPDIH
jgi:hypothetical protein